MGPKTLKATFSSHFACFPTYNGDITSSSLYQFFRLLLGNAGHECVHLCPLLSTQQACWSRAVAAFTCQWGEVVRMQEGDGCFTLLLDLILSCESPSSLLPPAFPCSLYWDAFVRSLTECAGWADIAGQKWQGFSCISR